MPRPRANSLTITITSWRAPRPPTPRRSTFPGANKSFSTIPTLSRVNNANSRKTVDTDIPPVPPLSYFEPDTPELLSPCQHLSLTSPRAQSSGRRASGPLSPNLHPRAFHYPGSPLSPVQMFSCIPSCEPSPMSPRFLFPRTPPLPPTSSSHQHLLNTNNDEEIQETAYCFGAGRRHSTPYVSSPLVLCGSDVPRTPQKLRRPDVDSPVRMYFKKLEGERGRRVTVRERRFRVLR